ncbi:MAG TPA: mechanosensitive ion channel family protein [Steroidobacteraceae bacterium]
MPRSVSGLAAFSVCLLTLYLVRSPPAGAQGATIPHVAAPVQRAAAKDPLDRNTPRGTVLGFLIAGRKGQNDLAAQYLNTRLSGNEAATLARQLFTVLDRRLPPKLPGLSELPEGSRSNPLRPDEDRVGTIDGAGGDVDILLERVDRGAGPLWLFSRKTLEAVPELYKETNLTLADDVVPEFMKFRIAGIGLYHWLAAFVGMPLIFYIATLLSRLCGLILGGLRRRFYRKPDLPNPELLPKPVRLLFLALVIRWTISKVGLSLFARQIWSSTATVITIAATAWLLIRVAGWVEQLVQRLLIKRRITGLTAIVRLLLAVFDLVIFVAAALVTVYRFGLNPAAFLTGLGVGGIAIALAAQKTLENIIGGVSLILDRVVRLGDIIALGDIRGTVEAISLRSTQIRTFDRTVVSVPNGQMANMTLENLSSRDKFWFHPILALRYGTTAIQIRALVDRIRSLLEQCRDVVPGTVGVHFHQFARVSLEVEVFAYVLGRDLKQFRGIRERLLLRIAECFESTGVQMAVPLQELLPGNASTSNKTHESRGPRHDKSCID